MAATNGIALVQSPINVTGILFNKTQVNTPLFSSIGSSMLSSRVFLTGATYDTGYPDPAAPAAGISEKDSLKAPEPQYWERENAFNVTQIFQRSVQISYRKLANVGDLTNYKDAAAQQPALVGNTNNTPNELAFQLANTLDAMRLDMENIIINGKFNDSKGVATAADSTRGLVEAIATNTIDAAEQELSFELLFDMAQKINDSGSPYGLDSYLTVVSNVQFKQLQKIVGNEGLKVDTTSAGVNVLSVITPFGTLRFLSHRFLQAGTLLCVCVPVLRNALQPTPGKGNFFFEELAREGASEHGQVYGQWGLDHGPEFLHAKITNLALTTSPFTAPQVYVTNMSGGGGGVTSNVNVVNTTPIPTEIKNADAAPVPTKVTNATVPTEVKNTAPIPTAVKNTDKEPVPTKTITA